MSTTPFEIGSGNVFADLGYPNAEEAMAKALLSRFIDKEIERRGLTQKEAAELLGCDQSDVSNVVRGRVRRFSIERLSRFLVALGHDVEIRVRPAESSEGHLLVHA